MLTRPKKKKKKNLGRSRHQKGPGKESMVGTETLHITK